MRAHLEVSTNKCQNHFTRKGQARQKKSVLRLSYSEVAEKSDAIGYSDKNNSNNSHLYTNITIHKQLISFVAVSLRLSGWLSSYECTWEVGREREKRLSGTRRNRVLL